MYALCMYYEAQQWKIESRNLVTGFCLLIQQIVHYDSIFEVHQLTKNLPFFSSNTPLQNHR